MKLSVIVILLNFLFIVKGQDYTAEKYTINPFINYLQENNYWEILVQVSIYFGNDISIEICKSFVPSPHCEEVVRIYISPAYTRMKKENEKYNIIELPNFLDDKQYSYILTKICKPISKYYELINKIIKIFS